MANTPIYGFETPDDTDLVKDGALSIRTALGDVDTTLGTALNSKDHAGLVLIKTQTIGTAVASVQVTDAFSATYDHYKIVLAGGAGSASTSNLLKIGNAATGYYASFNGRTYANVAITGGVANGTQFYFGEGATAGLFGIADICNPFKNLVTTMTGNANLITTTGYSYVTGGFLNNTNSYTDFTITPNTGTLTGGTIYVYGYGIS
jgi:hypothetical protein